MDPSSNRDPGLPGGASTAPLGRPPVSAHSGPAPAAFAAHRFVVAACALLLLAGLASPPSSGLANVWLSASQGEWLRDLAYTCAAAIAGIEIARGALAGLRIGHVGVELLVLVATAGALAIGQAGDAAAVSFAFVCGSWLEAHARGGFARRSVPRDASGAPGASGALGATSWLHREMGFVAGWYTPTVLAIAGAVLAIAENIPLALSLLVIARPRAMIAWISTATRGAVRFQNLVVAIGAAVALLIGVVFGAVPMAEAMFVQQASALAVLLNASRPARGVPREPR